MFFLPSVCLNSGVSDRLAKLGVEFANQQPVFKLTEMLTDFDILTITVR